jgi:hypothetical protein
MQANTLSLSNLRKELLPWETKLNELRCRPEQGDYHYSAKLFSFQFK